MLTVIIIVGRISTAFRENVPTGALLKKIQRLALYSLQMLTVVPGQKAVPAVLLTLWAVANYFFLRFADLEDFTVGVGATTRIFLRLTKTCGPCGYCTGIGVLSRTNLVTG